jgi:uncharacterized membrane protein YfcA
MWEWLPGALVAALAGFVQGCAGFGLGMTAAPALMLVLGRDPSFVTPVVLSMSAINSLAGGLEARRSLRWRFLLPLAAGGMAGTPLGIAVLRYVDDTVLRAATGAVVLAFAAALLTGWRRPMPNAPYTLFPVGLSSGFLGGALAMGGPPAILFLANQGVPRDHFRANLLVYFFISSCFGIALFALSGMYTREVAGAVGGFAAPLLAGTWLGVYLSRRIPEARFRQAVIVAAGLMGLLLLAGSVRALLNA